MKKILSTFFLTCLLFSCASKNSYPLDKFEERMNYQKPVVFYSNPVLLEKTDTENYYYDKESLSFNDKTLYVGQDDVMIASQLAEMVFNYIDANSETINRKTKEEDDGILKYILIADDNSTVASKLKVKAIRKRFDTLISNDGKENLEVEDNGSTKTGSLTTNDGKKFTMIEAGSFDMKNKKYEASTVTSSLINQIEKSTSPLDLVICFSDVDGRSIYNGFDSTKNSIPVFGVGGDSFSLKTIGNKNTGRLPYAGTVYINQSYLAYMRFRCLVNLIDNREDFYSYGITKEDSKGSVLKYPQLIRYDNENRQLLLSGQILNTDNIASIVPDYDNFDDKNNFEDGIKEIDNSSAIWVSRVKRGDGSLSGELNNFDDCQYNFEKVYFSKLKIKAQEGYNEFETDPVTGNKIYEKSESDFLKKFINLNDYQGYLINLYDSLNAPLYLSSLKQ